MLLVRPLLDSPKARLIATLDEGKDPFADDPTNRDTAFTRPRWRELMPELARRASMPQIARLVARLARANAALEMLARPCGARSRAGRRRRASDASMRSAFAALPDEIRLRLLHRAIDRVGYEGPAELGKVEALLDELDRAVADATAADSDARRRPRSGREGESGSSPRHHAAPQGLNPKRRPILRPIAQIGLTEPRKTAVSTPL